MISHSSTATGRTGSLDSTPAMRRIATRAASVGCFLLLAFAALLNPVPAQQISGSIADPETYEFGNGDPKKEALAELCRDLEKDDSPDSLIARGGQYLARRDLEGAAIHYLMVLAAEPYNEVAAYNLACAFSLGNEQDLAIKYLDLAVQNGYWGWDLMRVDHDLGNVREHERFEEILGDVEARYRVEAEARRGRAVFAVPQGEAPAEGWPLLVFLPGWGLNHESFQDVAVHLAKEGYAVIVPAGPIVMAEFMYRWDVNDVEGAHDYVTEIVERETANAPVRRGPYTIGGFSQGAYMATRLATFWPGDYQGVLAAMPAGGFEFEKPHTTESATLPMVLLVGEQDEANHRDLAEDLARAWDSTRQPVWQKSYPVSHRLPSDWRKELTAGMEWITQRGWEQTAGE